MAKNTARFDDNKLQGLITKMMTTHKMLESEKDLSPSNKKVASCIDDFIKAVLDVSPDPDSSAILNDPIVKQIRPELIKKLAQAEFEAEMEFAKSVASRPNLSMTDMNEFRYRQIYIDLVTREIRSMQDAGLRPDASSKICFIGSGPMPMTAIEMHLQTGAKIVCLDENEDAVRISREIVRKLGLEDKIEIKLQKGEDANYAGNDLVYVASLVLNKMSVISQIRTTAPNACIGARSAEGLKAILNEPVDKEAVTKAGYHYTGTSVDGNNTRNVTMFFQPVSKKPILGGCANCQNNCANKHLKIV